MDIITTIFDAVAAAVQKLVMALVDGAQSFIYVGTGETKELSTLALVVFTLVGISIAFAVVKWLLGLLKLN